MFYVAHGAPDSCGRGCDRWIAVEGQINGDAAGRFKQFIKQHLKDRHLPMYFSSPGGNLEQAIFIGNMLRELSATARVARTIVRDCGFEAQTSEVCLKLKRSGRELASDLTTRNAQCNSACPYLMLGATTREVAPDAILGVHSPKVVLRASGGQPTREMVVEATQRGVERADRLLSNYVFKMGIEGELLDVARHIKFEDMHVLTRDEMFRFGIDRREFVETPWTFENLGRALIRKSAISRGENGKTWRALQWRLFCVNAEQFQLDFQRQVSASPILAAISISGGGRKAARLCVSAGQARGVRGVGTAHAPIIGAGHRRIARDRFDRNGERAGWPPPRASGKIIDRGTAGVAGQPAGDVSAQGNGGRPATGAAKQRGKIVRCRPFMPRRCSLHAFACMLRPPTPNVASRPPH